MSVDVKAYKGPVGSELLADTTASGIIAVGAKFTVSGFAGSPNDVTWEIFEAGTSKKLGEST